MPLEPMRYSVDLRDHAQHLVQVTVAIPADVAPHGRLFLPVWTPGSYVVRDYARHVQQISAADADGRDITLTPDGRSAWRLPEDLGREPVEVRLELYANELTVRTNHVDDHHALLVSAATFPGVVDATDGEHVVEVHAPDGWEVWALLPEQDERFVADDYDHLVDSAFEAGPHEVVTYAVADVPHHFVWAGHGGRPDLGRVADDASRIGEKCVELFDGDLPSDAYTFVCNAWTSGGGLEHRDGAVLSFPVHDFADPDRYASFQSLLAHEYLHLWNVKRLVPRALTRLDYERPVHSPSLWIAEGWTAYYDELVPLRAGVWKRKRYLKELGELVGRVLERPGSRLQSVRMSSHEAWTKFYVRDENFPNVGVSYYEHGAVLAWCLDLLLRREAPDSDGLDDVVRLLWQRFGDCRAPGHGYTEADVEAATSEVAGRDLSAFFDDHVGGVDPPPVEDLVAVVGLRLEDEDEDDAPPPPDLGVHTREDDEGVVFTSVLRERPAWRSGLTGGDRLLAIDGLRVRRGELDKALRGYRAGDRVEVAVFRGPRLVTATVTLDEPRPERRLVPVAEPSGAQRDAFRRWSGVQLEED